MKNSNIDLRGIGEKLQAAHSVLLFPHVHPDGDAIGSSVALCRMLRAMGKEAWVVTEGVSLQLEDMAREDMCTADPDVIPHPDISIAIDCSERSRLLERTAGFDSGRTLIAIDHHRIRDCEMDLYYIDSEAAATSEIIYDLAMTMGWKLDQESCEALYTGIVTDTGSFKHSNTTPRTHRIAADLIEGGTDVNRITNMIFKNADPMELAVKADVFGRIEYFAGGKGAISSLSEEKLEELGAKMENAESVIDALAEIRGVEIASMLKEDKEGIRVSFRSKTFADVSAIASSLGGGGHMRAAGCTLHMSMSEAYETVKKAIDKCLDEGR